MSEVFELSIEAPELVFDYTTTSTAIADPAALAETEALVDITPPKAADAELVNYTKLSDEFFLEFYVNFPGADLTDPFFLEYEAVLKDVQSVFLI